MSILLLCALAAPFRMLGPAEPIDITSIAEANVAAIVYLDAADGTWFTMTPETALLLVARHQPPVPEGLRLQLTNGEVFPGRVEPTGGEDTVHWRHAWLGRLDVPLDLVAGISRQDIANDAQIDSVELINGDQWTGFCGTIGPNVAIEVTGSDAVKQHTVPMTQIRSLRLAGRQPGPPIGCSAFADGTVVQLETLRIDADGIPHHKPHRLTTQPGVGASVAQPMVLSIGSAVVPLAQMPIHRRDTTTLLPTILAGNGPMALGPIRLSGKGVWSMELPEDMHHLRARVTVPPHLRHLAAGTLLVLVDGTPQQVVDLESEFEVMLDIAVKDAKIVQFERTVGKHGEVGATVDLVDGVLVGSVRPRSKP